jgi:hypothetical protein
MKRLCNPVKRDFSRLLLLCNIRFSSVEIAWSAEIQAVIREADARHESHIRNERQTNPIQAVFSAPGGGKSRFLDMLADAVGCIEESCLRGSVVLPISYNGVVGTPSLSTNGPGRATISGLRRGSSGHIFLRAERGCPSSQTSFFIYKW